jgi:uncharacterized protein (DUF2141 family)
MRIDQISPCHVPRTGRRPVPAQTSAHWRTATSRSTIGGRRLQRQVPGAAIALLCILRAASAADASRIEVTVSGVADGPGLIGCALFSSATGFPLETPRHALANVRVTAVGGAATCVFEGIAVGEYAVAVVHDADDNGRANTNFLGAPTEGVGVSNNTLPSLSLPRFEDCRFAVVEGETKRLAIALRY